MLALCFAWMILEECPFRTLDSLRYTLLCQFTLGTPLHLPQLTKNDLHVRFEQAD